MGIRKTCAEIISDAAIQLGLAEAAIEDPYADGLGTPIVQLVQHLKSEGRRLARKHRWQALLTTASYTTSTTINALPTDFGSLVEGTAWDATGKRPLIGPLTPQQQEALIVGAAPYAGAPVFYIVQQNLFILPAPSSMAVEFQYVSTNWLESGADDPADALQSGAGSEDVPVFDADLMVCALKLAYLRGKGLDSTAAAEDYKEALREALGNDGAAGSLTLSVTPWRPRFCAPGDDGSWGT